MKGSKISMNEIKFNFSLNKECGSHITCPVCNFDKVHFLQILSVEFDNEKSDGIAIQFLCEEGHSFYQVFETYKGRTYTAFADNSTVVSKLITEYIDFESVPSSVRDALRTEDLTEKYFLLDERGKKVVDEVLSNALLRYLNEYPDIEE